MVWSGVAGLIGRYAKEQAMGELVLERKLRDMVCGVGHMWLYGWEEKASPNVGYDGSREGASHCDVAGGLWYGCA